MPKKIAFIGCSYSAYEMAGAYKDSWSFKLSKRFPQHTYINYAKGGHGPDYFRHALLDAKIREVDCIFLTTTFAGRHGMWEDKPGNNHTCIFELEEISENYSRAFNDNHTWTSLGNYNNHNRPMQKHLHKVGLFETELDYNNNWYTHAHNLYNFEKFFTLDFRPGPPFLYYHKHDEDVWRTICRIVGVNSKSDLWKKNVCLSYDDDHWTAKGHSLVLENYVLNEDVKNYLTQS